MGKYRKWLLASALWASMANAEYVKVSDDLNIHYLTSGEGPRVVLLVPGWIMSADVFEKQLSYFKDSKKYKLIAIDPRSQGLSTHTNEGNYYEQHGRDLNALIVKLNLNKFVLVGWSNGGFDALSYVHQFGADRLAGFVMLDAAPTGNATSNASEWAWYSRDDNDHFCEQLTQGSLNDRQKMNTEFAHWMVTNPTPEYMNWITKISNMTSDGVAALTNANSFYQDYRADLRDLENKVPLLYVVRQDWKHSVPKWSKENTPTASIALMDKHISFWEHPEQFNIPLEKFLGNLN
ncbi:MULTISPECIES: alpha/beta fold hydrolase [Pseudomonas]|uniref:Alpha/beta hydrolase n=1 Tax=Pseudomonas putida TaxID=303 RepID=A0A3M8TR02_PSEPU|nr:MULTISPECIES: alpha/beta hydrolase [Pseudomonas]KYC16917.1 hypothetical protein WM94_22695 [Pseudomonas sp. ABFPK]QUN70075.1 alpha/beta hydrolase [Pseudomonas sp. JS425]RNF94024.1 alpha/beta hydrolase [Pseudomonas putida]